MFPTVSKIAIKADFECKSDHCHNLYIMSLMFQLREYYTWNDTETKAVKKNFTKYISGDMGKRNPGIL